MSDVTDSELSSNASFSHHGSPCVDLEDVLKVRKSRTKRPSSKPANDFDRASSKAEIIDTPTYVDPDNPCPDKHLDPEKEFRLSNKYLHLTYKTHIPKKELYNFFLEKYDYKIVFLRAAHEVADKRNPYPHTHLALEHKVKFDVKNARYADFKGIHPHCSHPDSIAPSTMGARSFISRTSFAL